MNLRAVLASERGDTAAPYDEGGLSARTAVNARTQREMGAQPRRVSFGSVSIKSHEMILDGSKLPSDGLAPLGLGDLVGETVRSVEEHEAQRSSDGSSAGVRHVSTEQRRDAVGHDASALLALERANREIIQQAEDGDGGGWGSLVSTAPSTDIGPTRYSTAAPDERRTGHSGGFCEVDEEAEARRKQRALDAAAATATRKAERRRCSECKRFACLC
jgi:hypothetical protein